MIIPCSTLSAGDRKEIADLKITDIPAPGNMFGEHSAASGPSYPREPFFIEVERRGRRIMLPMAVNRVAIATPYCGPVIQGRFDHAQAYLHPSHRGQMPDMDDRILLHGKYTFYTDADKYPRLFVVYVEYATV